MRGQTDGFDALSPPAGLVLATRCWIGLYENDIPFRAETVNFMEPARRRRISKSSGRSARSRCCTTTPPLPRTVPETTIILEYLQQHYPGSVRLFPDEAEAGSSRRGSGPLLRSLNGKHYAPHMAMQAHNTEKQQYEFRSYLNNGGSTDA